MAKKQGKDVEEVYAGGIHFRNKEAKERLKKSARNINPKTKEDVDAVHGLLSRLADSYDKYPRWVFRTPQEVLDKFARGEGVKVVDGGWISANMRKYDEQQRQKRRERYQRKKQEEQQKNK